MKKKKKNARLAQSLFGKREWEAEILPKKGFAIVEEIKTGGKRKVTIDWRREHSENIAKGGAQWNRQAIKKKKEKDYIGRDHQVFAAEHKRGQARREAAEGGRAKKKKVENRTDYNSATATSPRQRNQKEQPHDI